MTLRIRKIIAMSLIAIIFLAANIIVVANRLVVKGVDQKANWLREEFLKGTAIAVIISLLILLTGQKWSDSSRTFGFIRRYTVCEHRLIGKGSYCSVGVRYNANV